MAQSSAQQNRRPSAQPQQLPVLQRLRTLSAWAILSCTLAVGSNKVSASDIALEPAELGPYRVACSNVEQDFSRAQGSVSSYWEGSNSVRRRYLDTLLLNPDEAISFTITAPNSRNLFRNHRNTEVQYYALVCYPTADDNPRAPYPLPDGRQVPAMQRGGEAPLLPQACADDDPQCGDAKRWPLLVYSHGLSGSPLSRSYLETMSAFASHGYIVAAPFHGDPRFSRVRLEDLRDVDYFFRNFAEIVEMQAIRPLAVQGLIDHLLGSPSWAAHIDAERIGGFGASMGGQTMLLLAGAELSYNLERDRRQVTNEPRLRAIVTYVPYSGAHDLLPAFGSDQRGARGIRTPYLGITGSEDDTAPAEMTERAIERLTGPRYLIEVKRMGHGSGPEVLPEAYAWYLTFFDAHLHGDRAALSRLYRATHVAGGLDDRLQVAVQTGVAARADEALAQEFYHPDLDHYFISAHPDETSLLLNRPELGWQPTEVAFAVSPADDTTTDSVPVCRFYGDPVIGPNSHFFTAAGSECDGLIALEQATPTGLPAWHLEGIAFNTFVPDEAGECPAHAPFAVWRSYNGQSGNIVNGKRQDANHRYTIQADEPLLGSHTGWQVEGVAFCSPAPLLNVVQPSRGGNGSE